MKTTNLLHNLSLFSFFSSGGSFERIKMFVHRCLTLSKHMPYPVHMISLRIVSVKDQIETENIQCIIGYYEYLIAIAAEKTEVPYLTTTLWGGTTGQYTFHMLPKHDEITQPLKEIMETYHWRRVAVIYEETLGETDIFNPLLIR